MGIRNKQRRAAKAKARARDRRRQGPDGGGQHAAWASDPPSPAELITDAISGAAHAYLDGDDAAPGECADALTAIFGTEVLDAAVLPTVERLVTALWQGGWLPHDLHQIAQRRISLRRMVERCRGGSAVAYLVDAIAAEARPYPAARTHPRWLDQLRALDATVWWQPDRPHLTQWAARHEATVVDGVRCAIEVIALLASLPCLPRILPPPGTATGGEATTRGVDQKVLARIRGLLAKAESTGFAEEAEALSAKAQELMARHALQRAAVEAEGGDRPEPATARRLWLDNPYVGAKALLVDAVASANRCRTVYASQLGFITVLGDEVDLELVELLTTSLLVQATKAMLASGSQVTRRGQSRTRSYRQSFLVAYATRIGERLSTAAHEGVTAARVELGDTAPEADSRLLPVLAAREEVVDALFDEMFPDLTTKAVSVSNAEGYRAGRAAADLAVLDARRSVSA